MFAKEREKFIVNNLKEHGSVNVTKLSEALQVSSPTIRSDLDKLSDSDPKILRTHGGAVYQATIETSDYKYSKYQDRATRNKKEKKEIAKQAISLINYKETILLDSSSTCYELAKLLAESENRNTVITNGFNTARLLKENPSLTVVITGGVLQSNSNTIYNQQYDSILDDFNIDKYFFSASGLSLESGFSEFNIREVTSKKEDLKRAREKIALIDSSKFDKDSSSTFCSIDDIDLIITDSNLSLEVKNKYNKRVPINNNSLVIPNSER